MAALVVRNLSEETHRALKARAAAHSRSTEAEVRAILDAAVAPPDRVKLGSLLAGLTVPSGGIDLDLERSRHSSDPIELG